MPVGDLLPELVMLVGAAVIVLFASFSPRRHQALGAGLALLTLSLAVILTLFQRSETPRLTFSGVWSLDRATIAAKVLILVAGVVTVALSPRWMATDRRHGEYYAVLLFSLLGAIMMASATDTMELVVGVLLSSVASYPLVAYHRAWGPSLEAGMKYFLMGALANALLVVGIVLIFGLTGATGYAEIARELNYSPDPIVSVTALAFVFMGLAFKLGAFPVHAWMPDVAQGAPAPIAGLLTVVPKVAAAIALARFVQLLPGTLAWPWVIAGLATLTMTLGNLAALWQKDLRRLLGWSAVSQSGYALMGVTVVGAAASAVPSLLMFLVAYTVANLAAFAAVTHLRGRTSLDDYRGLARVRPWSSTVVILALLSFVGIPPLAGFMGKLLLFQAAIDGGYGWLAVVAVANTVLSLFYYLRVIAPMVFDKPSGEFAVLGKGSGAAMVITGVLVLALGIWAQVLLGYLDGVQLLPG